MSHDNIPYNNDYIHHQKGSFKEYLREVVFGVQDGMVSTLGAVTGIAIGSQDHFTVILAGCAIIAVESVSMAVGSYTSTLSEKHITERVLSEELSEIKQYPAEEKTELYEMYVQGGWPEDIALKMADTASMDHGLMLREMAHYELQVVPGKNHNPIPSALFMFFAYIAGGMVPLFPYLVTNVNDAIMYSIFITLVGLFILGAFTTKFTKQPWMRSGVHMLVFGGIALLVGYLVGVLASGFGV